MLTKINGFYKVLDRSYELEKEIHDSVYKVVSEMIGDLPISPVVLFKYGSFVVDLLNLKTKKWASYTFGRGGFNQDELRQVLDELVGDVGDYYDV